MNILIVEDDIDFGQALMGAIETMADVELIDSYKKALKIIESKKIDILISDYFLSDGNGLDLIEKIKIKNANIKTILISGGATKDIAIRGINLNISALLEKPFKASELKKIIYNLFDQGPIQLNEKELSITIKNKSIHLTSTEFKIFHLLYKNPDCRISRHVITKKIWGEIEVSDNTFDTHLGNLKKKLCMFSEILTNKKGVGYSLDFSKII